MKRNVSLTCDVIRKIRKANYWQIKKDEWKKHGAIYTHFSLSDLITDDLLQGYMDNGWQEITDIYKQGNIGYSNNISDSNNITDKRHRSELMNNFSSCDSDQQELVLEILGSIRKYMVKNIFHCLIDDLDCGHLNEIISVGSCNVTSDYDVSIIGPDANIIMWKMFVTFLAKFEDDLPSALDVNLYASPLYAYQNVFNEKIICKSKDKLPQRVNYGNQQFTLVPCSQDDLNAELSWACVKIIDLNLNINNKLQIYIDNARKYKLVMNNLLNTIKKDETYLDISLQNNLHPANTITKNTREIIKRYYLQYLWQKPIQKYIYSSDNENTTFIEEEIFLQGEEDSQKNLFFYTGIPNYFACESYYTSCAVNTIVIENQINKPLELSNRGIKTKQWMYFISAIENTGDYLRNIKEDLEKISDQTEFIQQKQFQIIIIKYSKYLYRIYDMLGKIGIDSDQFIVKAFNLQKYVIPFRKKKYNLDTLSSTKMLTHLHYNGEYPLCYINTVSNILAKYINKVFLKII